MACKRDAEVFGGGGLAGKVGIYNHGGPDEGSVAIAVGFRLLGFVRRAAPVYGRHDQSERAARPAEQAVR